MGVSRLIPGVKFSLVGPLNDWVFPVIYGQPARKHYEQACEPARQDNGDPVHWIAKKANCRRNAHETRS